jgi:hypothetical protein
VLSNEIYIVHREFAANLPHFAANLPSSRMSPPTDRELTLPSSLLPAPPPRQGVGLATGLPASTTLQCTVPTVYMEDQQLLARPSPRLPASSSHRVGTQHRLVREPLTPLSALPALPPSPDLSASPSRVAGRLSSRDRVPASHLHSLPARNVAPSWAATTRVGSSESSPSILNFMSLYTTYVSPLAMQYVSPSTILLATRM